IARLKEQYGETPLYVLTHSHGGNVAFYSLGDPVLARQISGVVCLATPFLHLQLRRLKSIPDLTLTFVTFPIFMVLATLGLWLGITKPLVTVPILLAMSMTRRLARGIAARWETAAAHLVAQYNLPPIDRPVLILRSVSDEASLVHRNR